MEDLLFNYRREKVIDWKWEDVGVRAASVLWTGPKGLDFPFLAVGKEIEVRTQLQDSVCNFSNNKDYVYAFSGTLLLKILSEDKFFTRWPAILVSHSLSGKPYLGFQIDVLIELTDFESPHVLACGNLIVYSSINTVGRGNWLIDVPGVVIHHNSEPRKEAVYNFDSPLDNVYELLYDVYIPIDKYLQHEGFLITINKNKKDSVVLNAYDYLAWLLFSCKHVFPVGTHKVLTDFTYYDHVKCKVEKAVKKLQGK